MESVEEEEDLLSCLSQRQLVCLSLIDYERFLTCIHSIQQLRRHARRRTTTHDSSHSPLESLQPLLSLLHDRPRPPHPAPSHSSPDSPIHHHVNSIPAHPLDPRDGQVRHLSTSLRYLRDRHRHHLPLAQVSPSLSPFPRTPYSLVPSARVCNAGSRYGDGGSRPHGRGERECE
jgi:hypothetical protein